MDDFIRREDALKALYNDYAYAAMDVIKRLPAADVAEVARCKDCEYAERYERTNGTAGYYCGHPKNRFTYGERWDRVFKPVKEANDFCSYGEYQTNMGGVTNE